MEPRCLLAADLTGGVVYIEDDIGSDIHGDVFELTFEGGAPGTELTRAVIDTNQSTPAFGLGDLFFDTDDSGLGADNAFDFTVVSLTSADPRATVNASVTDGGTSLTLEFAHFHAGDKLVFNIDVDEVEDFDPAETDLTVINDGFDPIASGVEFQGSGLTLDFAAPHYFAAQGEGVFRNRYDAALSSTNLDLSEDNVDGKRDRTAGAIVSLVQDPLPIEISGTVYLDANLNLHQDAGETGIGDVVVELWNHDGDQYVFTGLSDTTDSAGNYHFSTDLGLLPGTYQLREQQPAGLFSVGAIPGTVNGADVGDPGAGNPDLLTSISIPLGGSHARDYDFAEARPASISGYVYHDRDDDGQRETGEEGLEGVPVQLIPVDTVAPQSPITVNTNADGSYSFTGLAPGHYEAREMVQPLGYFDGQDTVGLVIGVSSGRVAPGGDHLIEIFLGGGASGVEYNFGEVAPAELHGRVVLSDPSGDCVTTGEHVRPVAGAIILLQDQSGATIAQTTSDANGEYAFLNLRAGTYTLIEQTPAGLIDGGDHVGTVNGLTRGTLTANDTVTGIVLGAGEIGEHFDFCEHEPVAIGGFVYHDANNNGTFDSHETGIEGVTVELHHESVVIATTTTDETGAYSFHDLRAGHYELVELHPAGWLDGLDSAGTVETQVRGVAFNPGDTIREIELQWGDVGRNYNFGEIAPASIQGHVVMSDAFGNCDTTGIIENPIAGATVLLLNEQGDVVRETQTNSHGAYLFDNLMFGTYTVVEITPEGLLDGDEHVGTVNGTARGHLDGNDRISGISLAAGETAIGYDFCEHEPSWLAGFVYHDADNDGNFDAVEEGISGVTVILVDEAGEEVERQTTDAEGRYVFDNLRAGSYQIIEVHPDEWLDGLDQAGDLGGRAINPGDRILDISLQTGQHGDHYNFGELLPASIAGRVHVDANGNCLFEEGDTPLAGATLTLVDADGNALATTTTDAEGNYRFDELRPGTYEVHLTHPEEYLHGDQHAGSHGGDDSVDDVISSILVASGLELTDYDFCEFPTSSISGHVFQDGEAIVTRDGLVPDNIDELRDGILTPDDRPLAGVVLELRNGITGVPIDASQALPGLYPPGPLRAVTDANGFYQFLGLPRGNYAVYELQPNGYVDSIDTPGSTSGIAINPRQQISPLFLQSLQVDPGNDAIIRIPLGPGQDSVLNNFSEILVEREAIPLPPPIVPPRAPDLPPLALPPAPIVALPPFVPAVPDPIVIPIYGGGMTEMTWHLSVIDAGLPRRLATNTQEQFRQTTSTMRQAWDQDDVTTGRWTIAVLHADGTPQSTVETNNDEIIFGVADGIPVTGDFDGDGVTDVGVYFEGNWYLDLNGNRRWDEEDLWALLGDEEDLPVTGDWDGDGKDDIGIYGPEWPGDPRAAVAEPGLPDPDNRPTTRPKNVPPTPESATSGKRLMKRSATSPTREDLIDHVFYYGHNEDVPVTGDWNGDGIRTIGIYRDGVWLLDTNGDGRHELGEPKVNFGRAGARPVVGDFDGNGIDDLGVFVDGTWYLDTNGNRELDAHDRVFELGGAGDIPVTGDWNGDGIDDPAVYRHAESIREARSQGQPHQTSGNDETANGSDEGWIAR